MIHFDRLIALTLLCSLAQGQGPQPHLQIIRPVDPSPTDRFAWELDCDGGVLVVGDTIKVGPSGTIEGGVLVHEEVNGSWVESQVIFAPGGGTWKSVGSRLLVHDGEIFVWASFDTPASVGYPVIYVYRESPVGWVLAQTIASPRAQVGEYFGTSFSASGDRLAVSAHGYKEGTDPQGDEIGIVYIFEKVAGLWEPVDAIHSTLPNAPGSTFGRSVSLDGDLLIVGDDRAYTLPQVWPAHGAAFVFEYQLGTWVNTAKFISTSQGRQFGFDVAIDGGRFTVGEPSIDNFYGPFEGRVHVFEQTGPLAVDGGWEKTAVLAASDGFGNNQLGKHMDFENGLIFTAAHGGSGKGYLFHESASGWEQLKILKPFCPTGWFGISTGFMDGWAFLGSPDQLQGTGRVASFRMPIEHVELSFRRSPSHYHRIYDRNAAGVSAA